METLKLATRPVVLILMWLLVSAYTISQLSTVDRALRTAEAPAVASVSARSRAHSARLRAESLEVRA